MTTNFTASNGDTIETRPDGYLVVRDGHHTEWVSPLTVTTLREYLQHRRDAELGRWRDPENPDAVVYRSGPNSVRVLYETDGASFHCRRDDDPLLVGMDTAARYFAAHPELPALPDVPNAYYLDKDGDVWRTDHNGTLSNIAEPHVNPERYAPFIRLHPEESDDE